MHINAKTSETAEVTASTASNSGNGLSSNHAAKIEEQLHQGAPDGNNSVQPTSATVNLTPQELAASVTTEDGSTNTNEVLAITKQEEPQTQPKSGLWQQFTTIELSHFKHKSLSAFNLNPVVGCFHGCRFCYVPEISTKKLASKLKPLGVDDPDAEWGTYGFVRIWDEDKFRKSLEKAEKIAPAELPDDGHRAVMLSTTTDPYHVIKHSDAAISKKLTDDLHGIVTHSLEMILEESTLNVRILTRGLLAKKHFPLFKKFGKRLMFGVSIPTLNDKLARVYEPGAPHVGQRLKMLKEAKDAGLHVFVAIAPTYPECDEDDLRATLKAIAEIGPETVFMEPINMRAENIARIQAHAKELEVSLNTEVFATEETWAKYSIDQMDLVERLAEEVGLLNRLHIWPDPALGKKAILEAQPDPAAYTLWLQKYWSRVSEWAGEPSKVVIARPVVAKPKAAAKQETPAAETKKKAKLTLRSPDEILGMKFDAKDLFLENGVFAKGQSLTVLGPGGLGKSRLLLQLAVCTILGKPFIGMPVQSKELKWLVLQVENGNRRLQTDFDALKKWVGETDWATVEKNLVIHTIETPDDANLSLSDSTVLEQLKDVIAQTKPDVIAIDPLSGFAAGSLNNDAGMQKTCKALGGLATTNSKWASLVVLHHTLTGKAGAAKASGYDRGAYGRGSKTLNNWTRGQINLSAASGDNNDQLVVSCGKNSDATEFEAFGIRLNPDSHIYEIDPEFDHAAWQQEIDAESTTQPKLTAEAVAEFVTDAPLSKKELVKAIMDETGCQKSTAYAAVGKADGKTLRLNKDRKFEKIA